MIENLVVKTLRLPPQLMDRIRALSERSSIGEAEIYRVAIVAGLERLEGGEFNPFTDPDGKKPKK
jgi:predicted DNA-binding protein